LKPQDPFGRGEELRRMQGAQDRGPSRTYPRRRDAPHVGQVDVRLERKLLLRETPLFTEATDVPRMARSSPARAMQVRQVQTWIGDRRHRLHQSWQAKRLTISLAP
jgi:hypothetical protein